MKLPQTAPGLEQMQAIRLRRYSLAACAYLLTLFPLAFAYGFGFMERRAALTVAAAIVVLNTALFAAFRTLVETYGEEATAVFAESLPEKLRGGAFSCGTRH